MYFKIWMTNNINSQQRIVQVFQEIKIKKLYKLAKFTKLVIIISIFIFHS